MRACLYVAAACLLALNARAELCTVDRVPAATLLFPYFQVDLNGCDGGGVTTILRVRNASDAPAIAQLTLYTDLDRAVTAFPLAIAPFGTVTVDLRDVLCDGRFPDTRAAGTGQTNVGDPAPLPPSCAGVLGDFERGAQFINRTQALLTGQKAPGTGLAAGFGYGDFNARGYVTVDALAACQGLTDPTTEGYFQRDAPEGRNVLLGDYSFTDPVNNFSFGDSAVHIEAAPLGFLRPGSETFYGRFVDFDATDQREPLPSKFFLRHDNRAGRNTLLVAWREGSGEQAGFLPFLLPAPYPLPAAQIEQFDPDTNPAPPDLVVPTIVTPAFTAEFVVDTTRLGWGAETSSGQIFLDLETDLGSGLRPSGPTGQAWLVVLDTSEGIHLTGHAAQPLNDRCPAGRRVTLDNQGPLAVNPNDGDFLFSSSFEE